jgi:hypothetical protein
MDEQVKKIERERGKRRRSKRIEAERREEAYSI